MKKVLISFLFLSLTSGVFAQSVEQISAGTTNISEAEHFYYVLSQQIFLSDLSKNLREEVNVRLGTNPQYRSILRNPTSYFPLSDQYIDLNDYSFADAGRGRYFTFATEEEFNRFKDFADIYNQKLELTALKNQLRTIENPQERLELFKRELEIAVNNYNSGDFRTAYIQFDYLINDYGQYYTTIDDLYFLRAESAFALKDYHNALNDYFHVVRNFSGASLFNNQSIYRILFIRYVFGEFDRLLSDYDELESYVTAKDDIYYNIQILMAVINHKIEEYPKVISLLQDTPREYPGYLMSNFIVGNSYAILDDVDNAIKYYSRIENTTLWPWDSDILKKLKTSSLLQLGYLYYLKGLNDVRSGNVEPAEKGQPTSATYFALAREYFAKVERNHPEYSSAVLAEVWVDLQNAEYNTATLKVKGYVNNVNDQELIYQALFLEGYIQQRRNPGELKQSEEAYYYVINGMIANQFLSDFFEARNIITRQYLAARDYMDIGNIPSAALSAAQSLVTSVEEVSSKLGINTRINFSQSNQIFDDTILEELRSDKNLISRKKETVRQRGLRELVNVADSVEMAIDQIVSNPSADPISQDIVLFAQHSPLLIQQSEESLLNSYSGYRAIAGSERVRVTGLLRQVESAMLDARAGNRVPVLSYYRDVLKNLVRKYASIEVVLYERDFYRQQTEIERWGDASAYGLTALMFEELERRKNETLEYRRVRSELRNAIQNKREQLEDYLSDLRRIDDQQAFMGRIDSINIEFENQLTDYRSVYFNPISTKKISEEQYNKIFGSSDAKKEEEGKAK